MAFDPNLPTEHTLADAVQMRAQLNGLKDLIDAQQATIYSQQTAIDAHQTQIVELQAALNGKVDKAGMGEFDPGFSDPPPIDDLQAIRAIINDMINTLDGN